MPSWHGRKPEDGHGYIKGMMRNGIFFEIKKAENDQGVVKIARNIDQRGTRLTSLCAVS
jgi:hypothetical protein